MLTMYACLFVLRFYGPVNPMGSCRARSVYLTTHLLGRLSPLTQCMFLWRNADNIYVDINVQALLISSWGTVHKQVGITKQKCIFRYIQIAKGQISLCIRAFNIHRIIENVQMESKGPYDTMILCACARWSNFAHLMHVRRHFLLDAAQV